MSSDSAASVTPLFGGPAVARRGSRWQETFEKLVAAACTAALLGGNDSAVRQVCERIGAEIHHRVRSAMGPDADHRTVSALEMTYLGALVLAGSGVVSYHQIADRLAYVVGIMLGDKS